MSAFLDAWAERFALLYGLALFYGFAFEQIYGQKFPLHPGGVRTFPLLALAGGTLYLLDETYKAAFVAGLLVLGAWMYRYIGAEIEDDSMQQEGAFIIPGANVLAYVLGAVALSQPVWIPVTLAVAAVLLLSSRDWLHRLASRVPLDEVLTAGKFLILVGIVLPLLANEPAIPYTTITPFAVWLAVVAVSTISYASYLLLRYVFPSGGTLLTAFLGGLYSSTATTVVLARRARDEGVTPELSAGMVAATGMMYLRVLVVCALFNLTLARALLLPLAALACAAFIAAWLLARSMVRTPSRDVAANPLQLGTAFVFAALMVALSLVTNVVQSHAGASGVLALSALVGFTDIDPFVLSLAQGGVATTGLAVAAIAITIATSSNNVLKAVYAAAFARRREAWIPAATLIGLAVLGLGTAYFMPR
ncbi:MAG: DUF4010 domain-containing protein [Candidatus Eremiobacteraeota bacterium]|nr:DUF4010 domain-containing protein [Candidatus Eremiobacteraeota bacterium]